MTEREKRDAGQLYHSDGVLAEERFVCKDLCHQINQLRPSQIAERNALLRQLLGKTPEQFYIEPPFWCDYGYQITIGEDFYANHNLLILDGAPVTFGSHVFIAPDCGFYTAGHPINAEKRNEGLEYALPITVGDNVWIGGGVRVLPGVTIGSDVVIGAGSVVTKDIPDHVVAAGNPCRVLRAITPEDREERGL